MLNKVVVTAAQMRAIESKMFDNGIPVAALMEKVAGRITQRLDVLYPTATYPRVGVLVGPGHNGGDALVVARELWHRGRQVKIYLPFTRLKPLTESHWNYARSLGIAAVELENLRDCDLLVDGLFGFGLEKELTGSVAEAIAAANTWQIPVLSIDLPSGLHTDTGAVMGVAIIATHTLCLGLWKRSLLAEIAVPYAGKVERLDFDIPVKNVLQELGTVHPLWRIDPCELLGPLRSGSDRLRLPLLRAVTAHKYQVGHLLIVAGSRRYGGAAILAALGAKASGAGMLTVAVPLSLRDVVLAQVPDALVVACPETESGAIAQLPDLNLEKYNAIACGPGLSLDAEAVVRQVLETPSPLVLDADGLNLLAKLGIDRLQQRVQAARATVLTPHWGEFRRLFPHTSGSDRLDALRDAALETGAIVLLKGARTAISFSAEGVQQIWINPESTPALARGGSGDVLTGLIGGLVAQGMTGGQAAIAAAVWHAQTAIWLVDRRTEMGVDPVTLAQNLLPFLQSTGRDRQNF